uniref:Ubiquitin-like domain-containing protein n=1 Tax=Chrysemys picta bellii TaxID=8478 RepID=A0A8C3F5Q7_CHRPI
MDVFLMIRRHKMTIFADAKETTTVQELKKIVEGILKRPPEEQQLYKDDCKFPAALSSCSALRGNSSWSIFWDRTVITILPVSAWRLY